MKDGQYIELQWEGRVLFEAVRGWVGEEATRRAIEAFACNEGTRSWAFRECYAANLQSHDGRCNGYHYTVQLYATPARGRYKVSVLEPLNPALTLGMHSNQRKKRGETMTSDKPHAVASNALFGVWMPIETCPLDEKPMDIWSTERGRCVDMVRIDAGHGNIWWDAVECGYNCVRDATHWMRVSKPNTDSADAQVREMPLATIISKMKVGDVGYPWHLRQVPENCRCQFDLATGKVVNYCKECSTA